MFRMKPPIRIVSRASVTVLLTHWGRVTHICVGEPTIIGSDNGLSPDRRQAIIWTNAGILLIGPLGTYFSEILTGIQTFSFRKMHLKMSSAKWRPFCLGFNVLTTKSDILISKSRWLSLVQNYTGFSKWVLTHRKPKVVMIASLLSVVAP